MAIHTECAVAGDRSAADRPAAKAPHATMIKNPAVPMYRRVRLSAW